MGFTKRQNFHDVRRFTEVLRGTMGNWTWHLFESMLVLIFKNIARIKFRQIEGLFSCCLFAFGFSVVDCESVGVQRRRILIKGLLLLYWFTMRRQGLKRSTTGLEHIITRPENHRNEESFNLSESAHFNPLVKYR